MKPYNSLLVHSQLSYNGFPTDGALVGAGSYNLYYHGRIQQL